MLARKAKAAGVVYSLAWGDQPALICEHVDWARACGFKVIAAGKGTRYEPHYHQSNPDNVWDILDKYLNISDRKSINPKMFNSFVDGTKSGIEMTAVCNATGLVPQTEGLSFPPATRFELADVCKPKSAGGTLEKEGVTEVTSSVYRDGRDVPHHLALGTYVVIEGETEYARRCFKEYAMLPDRSGRYAALYRPIHMIGLELGISVASAALRHEPTGAPTGFRSDVAATAKRNLKKGEVLDGEGGFCVWGKQTPADAVARAGLFPARPCAERQAQARHCRGRAAEMVGRRVRSERCRRAGPPRDGGCVRPAERLVCNARTSSIGGILRPISGRAAALSLGPPITITITTTTTNAAALLDIAHIGDAEAVIRYGMLACGLQAILLDGGTHLLALTRVWRRLHLRVAFDRQQQKHSCDCDSAHFLAP